MFWALEPGSHPLRFILRSHLKDLSQRKWGTPDFMWMMTKGGGHRSQGSADWGNLCLAWSKLKPLLAPSTPRNVEEWGLLPLWSPHQHCINPGIVCCTTQAQKRLRELAYSGWSTSPLSWDTLSHGLILVLAYRPDTAMQRAYESLISNIRATPDFPASTELLPLFFENLVNTANHIMWQFQVLGPSVSNRWESICSNFSPIKAFEVRAGTLIPRPGSPPAPQRVAHRILVRKPQGRPTIPAIL